MREASIAAASAAPRAIVPKPLAPNPLARSIRFPGVRVLVASVQRLFAEAIGATLEARGLLVGVVATSGDEAMAAARQHKPDLILLDLGPPESRSIQVGENLLREFPDARLVMISGIKDPHSVGHAMRAGFHGYLMKDAPITQFISTIEAILSGQVVVPYGLASAAAGARSPQQQKAEMLAQQLTNREREVLALLVNGTAGKEMASRLTVSLNTVRTHIQNVLTKLGVHSQLEAAAFAVQHRLVPLGLHGDNSERENTPARPG